LTLETSGGSGNGAVTYAVTSAGSAVCSISGSTLSFTSAGTCSVTATKAAANGFAEVSSSATTITITAYTVTYDSKGGSSVTSGSFGVGGSITEPTAPTRTGYTFDGWSATDGGTAVTWPYSPGGTSNITLYAKWTLRYPYLSFNATDSSSYAGSGTSVTDTSFNGLLEQCLQVVTTRPQELLTFAGATSGSFANPSSRNPNLADGLSVQFMADVKATTADWSMVFDFGTNLNNNYVRAQFWNGPFREQSQANALHDKRHRKLCLQHRTWCNF
jgi:uncharacterized repeat protein (TIGR02543 family)